MSKNKDFEIGVIWQKYGVGDWRGLQRKQDASHLFKLSSCLVQSNHDG